MHRPIALRRPVALRCPVALRRNEPVSIRKYRLADRSLATHRPDSRPMMPPRPAHARLIAHNSGNDGITTASRPQRSELYRQ